jgi:hypothetical protein
MPLHSDGPVHLTSVKNCDGQVVHLPSKMQDFATSLTPLEIPPVKHVTPVIMFEMDDEMVFDPNYPIKPYERTMSLVSPSDVEVPPESIPTTTTLGPIAPPVLDEDVSSVSWRQVSSKADTSPLPWRRSDRPEKRNKQGFTKRQPSKSPKMELHNVLNCFQVSDTVKHGIYVSEELRDPRYARLDSYYYEVQDSVVGLTELRRSLGPNSTPLSRESQKMFVKLQGLLGNLADRIGKVLDQQPAECESCPCVKD